MATSPRYDRIYLLLLVGAALLFATYGALAAERKPLRISLTERDLRPIGFTPKSALPEEINAIRSRLQPKWEVIWAAPTIASNSKAQFKISAGSEFDRMTAEPGSAEFNVAVFVKRTKDTSEKNQNLVLSFGPKSLMNSGFFGTPTGEYGTNNSLLDWRALRMIKSVKGGQQEIPATFEYAPTLLRSPYIVVCGSPCTGQDLSQIENAIKPDQDSSRASVEEVQQQGAKTKSVTLWILEQNAAPSTVQAKASIASSCNDRRKRGAEKPVAGLNTTLDLPEGHTAQTACIVVRTFGETCWPFRLAPVVQIPAVALKSFVSELSCPKDSESVDIVFRVIPAKQAEGKSPEQLRDLGRDQDLQQIRSIAGAVTLLSAPATSQPIDLPITQLNELNALSPEEARKQFPLTLANGGYKYVRPLVLAGSYRRRVELLLVEQFSRLGDFDFRPVNSNNMFEENCIALLVVPPGARLNSAAWQQASQRSPDAFESSGGVKLNIRSDPARYYFPDNMLGLPVAIAEDSNTPLKIRFSPDDKSCRDYETEFPVPRTAFFGTPFAPKVHKARPYFFSIATRDLQAARAVGLTPPLETEFWLSALRMMAVVERSAEAPQRGRSRYEQAVFAFWLSPPNPVQNWTARGELLLADDNVVRNRAYEFGQLVKTQDPASLPFDFRTQLRDALARLAGGSTPFESGSPNARILLLGPKLGSSESGCVALQNPVHDRLATWLRSGDAKLVFVEFYDPKQSANIDANTFVGPGHPRHLRECKVPPKWENVARSFLIGADGLIGASSESIFEYLKTQIETFYGL